MATRKTQSRVEQDHLGEMTIPAGAFWGVSTARCLEYFGASGQRVHPKLFEAMVHVKKACATTNGELGIIDESLSTAIVTACNEILQGELGDQSAVDSLCGGSGIALNINASEVVANRAGEILGGQPGIHDRIHPERHVNLSQAPGDAYITASRIAILLYLSQFKTCLLDLERLLRRKSLEFERIVKPGRTYLRDSVPVTLGQEFNAYGSAVEKSLRRIQESAEGLKEINLGGTFVGTGYNATTDFQRRIVDILSSSTGLELKAADDYFRLGSSMGDFVEFSSSLKELAVDLIKVANDLRLLSSGPATGFAEIVLPEVLTAPSDLLPDLMSEAPIPPLTEDLAMICFQVLGNDHVVTLAAQSGQLETNSMTPLISHNILSSMAILEKGILSFSTHCLARVTANSPRCREAFERSGALVAALSTELGYQKASEVVSRASASGQDVKDFLLETKLITESELDRLFHHRFMTTPGRMRASDDSIK
ncbi:MAG: aspartate ammonia-lyase [Cyanobacteria bacterium HKST-UBA02]|nr:aspartate ammonia-lyase [Cyanobacteria bacterium HKST-UBA02]